MRISSNDYEGNKINDVLFCLFDNKFKHSNRIKEAITNLFDNNQRLFERIIEAFYKEFNFFLSLYFSSSPQEIFQLSFNKSIIGFLLFINYSIRRFPKYYFMKNNIGNLLLIQLLSNFSTRLIDVKKFDQVILYNSIGSKTQIKMNYYTALLQKIEDSLFDMLKGIYENKKNKLYDSFFKGFTD